MNALNADFVPVKTLSALAQLVALLLDAGLSSTCDLMKVTGYSRRAIQVARKEIETEGGAQRGAQVRSIVRRGAQRGAQGNLPHGENSCAAPMLYTDSTYCNGTVQNTQLEVAGSEQNNIRARENPSLAGSLQSSAGSALQSPQTPTPSPKPTLETLTKRLAPMLTSGETPAEKLEHAEEHIKNLLHAYDEGIINKGLTRLQQRVLDGYKVQSFSRMLTALCEDVERDMAAKKPERPVPWGTIDLGNGHYVSEWG